MNICVCDWNVFVLNILLNSYVNDLYAIIWRARKWIKVPSTTSRTFKILKTSHLWRSVMRSSFLFCCNFRRIKYDGSYTEVFLKIIASCSEINPLPFKKYLSSFGTPIIVSIELTGTNVGQSLIWWVKHCLNENIKFIASHKMEVRSVK